MLPHPACHQWLVLKTNHLPGGLVLFSDRSPKQLKAILGIMTLMLEIKFGLVRAPINKISQGHML
jgi:hypothetical protein